MTTFIPRTIKSTVRASEHFLKLQHELDMSKYKLDKYKELFMLGSFQAMHDADLAYDEIYHKCALNATTKEGLLKCLDQEEQLSIRHPESFDDNTYRLHLLKAIAEIRQQVKSGSLDYLYH